MTSVTVTASSACTVDRNRTPKTEIRLATVDEMLAEAQTLFDEHYEEIARNKQVMVLKPDGLFAGARDGQVHVVGKRADHVKAADAVAAVGRVG